MGATTLVMGVLVGVCWTLFTQLCLRQLRLMQQAKRVRQEQHNAQLVNIHERLDALLVANNGIWSELDRQKRARRSLERQLRLHLESGVRMPTEEEMADLFDQIPRP